MKNAETILRTDISSTDLNDKIAEVTNKVAYGNQTFTITKHGKPVAEIRPIPKPDNSNGKKSA